MTGLQAQQPANATFQQKGAKKCVEELASPSPLTREKALWALGRLGNEAIPFLGVVLERLEGDEEASVRAAAAEALSHFCLERERRLHRPALERVVKEDASEEAKEAARQALRNFDAAEAEDRAKALLGDWQDLQEGDGHGSSLLERVRLGHLRALVGAPPLLLYNRAFALEAVKRNVRALEYLDPGLWGDRIVIAAALEVGDPLHSGGEFIWQLATEELREDPAFVRQALEINGYALEFMSESQRMDRQLVMAAVRQAGGALRHASVALRADEAVVREAVRQDGLALEFAHEQLQASPQLAYEAAAQNISAMKFAPSALRADRSFVLRCLRHSTFALNFAADALRGDREFIVEAIKQDGIGGRDGLILQYSTQALQSDPDMLLLAMRRSVSALRLVPRELMEDRRFVLRALQQTPCALRFASARLLEDRAFVVEAVRKRGACLECCPERFRSDREVVIEAVTSDRAALAFASEELRGDGALLSDVNRRVRLAQLAEEDTE